MKRGTNPSRHPYSWGEGRPQTPEERRAIEAASVWASPLPQPHGRIVQLDPRVARTPVGTGGKWEPDPDRPPATAAGVLRDDAVRAMRQLTREWGHNRWDLEELVEQALDEEEYSE
jgi:hypothetical protein